jgi:hypothetical protein
MDIKFGLQPSGKSVWEQDAIGNIRIYEKGKQENG